MATVKTLIGNVKGKDGMSITVAKVTESTASGGSNVVTFSDGKTLTVRNGRDGSGGAVTGDHTHANYLFREGNFLLSGADLADGHGTLTVASEVEETNYVKVNETLTSGALNGRWVLLNGKRAYVGSNTTNQLALYTDEAKNNPMNYSCPAGTVIYPADVCIDVATAQDLKELDARILMCTGVKVATGIVYPYMSPNLAGEVFSLRTDGETEETNYVKFRGAASPLATNSLVGRWVLIDGKRAYVGANTTNTLALYTDETKGNPMNYSCPSGTIIYPADVTLAGLEYVKKLIPSSGGDSDVVIVTCDGYDGERGQASIPSTDIKSHIDAGKMVLVLYLGGCYTYLGWDDVSQTAQFGLTTVRDQGDVSTTCVNIDYNGDFALEYNNQNSGGAELPEVTANDNGKFLRVVNGAWAAVALTDVSQVGG